MTMEYLIKDLIERLSVRKKKEMDLIEKYKDENLHDMLLISSGKVMEIEQLISDLHEMTKYNSRFEKERI